MNNKIYFLSSEHISKLLQGKKTIICEKANKNIDTNLFEYPHKIGDTLLVKECWALFTNEIVYRSSFIFREEDKIKWNPPVSLKKKDIRLKLQITQIELKSIGSLTNGEAEKNGDTESSWDGDETPEDSDPETGYFPPRSYLSGFCQNWKQKYGVEAIDDDYVWIIKFDRC